MRGSLVSVVLTCLSFTSANAAEIERSERFCSIDGLSLPLRQTVVVIDPRLVVVAENPDKALAANKAWIKSVVGLLDLQKDGIGDRFMPRERVSVVVGSTDADTPATIFSGCLPAMTEEEKVSFAKKTGETWGKVKLFFGQGLIAELDSATEHFNESVFRALSKYVRTQRRGIAVTDFVDSPLAKMFSQLGSTIEISRGVARLVLISDLQELAKPQFKAGVEARARGFAAGEAAPGDLKRSDVLVLSPSTKPNTAARDFLSAFLTRSTAQLSDWQTSSLTAFRPGPIRIERFIGATDYGHSRNVTMRLRLGADANGNLANSWVTVASSMKEMSMPLTGTLVCRSQTSCTITGDGRDFSQVWSSQVADTPELDPRLPFGGVQQFEATIEGGDTVKGKVFQPNVGIGSERKEYLSFQLKRVDGANF